MYLTQQGPVKRFPDALEYSGSPVSATPASLKVQGFIVWNKNDVESVWKYVGLFGFPSNDMSTTCFRQQRESESNLFVLNLSL